MLVSSDINKEISKKYTWLWDEIKDLLMSITDTSGDYDKNIWKLNLIQMIAYF